MSAGNKEEFTRKTGKLPDQDDRRCGKSQEHFQFGPMLRTYQNKSEVLVQIILISLGRNAPFVVRSLLPLLPPLIAFRVSKKPFSELTFPLEFSNQYFFLHASDSDHLPSEYACKVDVYLSLILPRTRSNHGVPRSFFSFPLPLH